MVIGKTVNELVRTNMWYSFKRDVDKSVKDLGPVINAVYRIIYFPVYNSSNILTWI